MTFLVGEVSKTVTVTVNADDLDELDETIILEYSGLSVSQGVVQRGVTTGAIQVSDDSPAGTIGDSGVTPKVECRLVHWFNRSRQG